MQAHKTGYKTTKNDNSTTSYRLFGKVVGKADRTIAPPSGSSNAPTYVSKTEMIGTTKATPTHTKFSTLPASVA